MDLAVEVPDVVLQFPGQFRWLAQQMMKSAESVPSNIAEGFERQSNGDFVRFLRIAKASLGELDNHLIYARRRDLIGEQEHDRLAQQSLRVRKMLSKLTSYLLKAKSKPRGSGTKNQERGTRD